MNLLRTIKNVPQKAEWKDLKKLSSKSQISMNEVRINIKTELQKNGVWEELKKFSLKKNRKSWKSYLYMCSAWSTIGLGTYISYILSWYLCPIGFLPVALGQTMLHVLNHDSSHNLLFKTKTKIHSFFLNIGIHLPLMIEPALYRMLHQKHHKETNSQYDPDYIKLNKNTYFTRIYLLSLWKNFKSSLKETSSINKTQKQGNTSTFYLKVALWWSAILTILWSISSLSLPAMFLISWFGAKITFFHLIKTFRGLAEHLGLSEDKLQNPITATRNIVGSPLTPIIYPFNNGYHLVHHLYPSIGIADLKKAHKILDTYSETYQKYEKFDGYLFGKNTIANSIAGK